MCCASTEHPSDSVDDILGKVTFKIDVPQVETRELFLRIVHVIVFVYDTAIAMLTPADLD